MAEIVLSSLRKAFGSFVAVHGLDLTINEGEFVSLLGPSGCGKTTTLRMLAGLEFPTSGDIRIGERIVTGLAPGKRDIAMVFQSYALYPHMTVRQNIAYPLRKRGVARGERAKAVEKAAELLQLGEVLERKPRQLSGGQQQRVALGRALVREPAVFLLDEPLSNLDAKLRAYMRTELIELHRRLGRTMVYVTHDQLEAMTMSDRIAVMNRGRLQQFASPDDVYNRPQNRFVASFIGTPTMNLIDGKIDQAKTFLAPGLELSLPDGLLQDYSGDGSLGVRPEHIRIQSGQARAHIRVVEPTGHENIIAAELENGPTLTLRTEASVRPKVGEIVPISLDPSGLHIFADGNEGARLNNHHADSGSPCTATENHGTVDSNGPGNSGSIGKRERD